MESRAPGSELGTESISDASGVRHLPASTLWSREFPVLKAEQMFLKTSGGSHHILSDLASSIQRSRVSSVVLASSLGRIPVPFTPQDQIEIGNRKRGPGLPWWSTS